jgi:hypothetical protein
MTTKITTKYYNFFITTIKTNFGKVIIIIFPWFTPYKSVNYQAATWNYWNFWHITHILWFNCCLTILLFQRFFPVFIFQILYDLKETFFSETLYVKRWLIWFSDNCLGIRTFPEFEYHIKYIWFITFHNPKSFTIFNIYKTLVFYFKRLNIHLRTTILH